MKTAAPILPYNELELGKKEQVRKMFNNIAGRYDLINRLLTLRIDVLWRRKAVRLVEKYPHETILDVATGTGDFALEFLKLSPGKITGVDIAENMLEVFRNKIKRKGLASKIDVLLADSEQLPFPDKSFDITSSAFGVRNFENLNKGLSEMCRVLKPGGRAVILECSEPKKNMPFRKLYMLYMSKICPSIGGLLSEDKAYKYLNNSMLAFPTGEEFVKELKAAGFADVDYIPVSLGIASIYIARKQGIEK